MEEVWGSNEAQRQQMERKLEKEVETAMSKLDKELRRPYETALEVFPDLVRRETRIMDFVRTEDYDTERAALRLALYWQYRKSIFQERWLLPMTQTGEGCLDAADIRLLRTGYCAVFPHGARTGGGLIVNDHARARGFDHRLHVRLMMYLCTTFTNEKSQLYGGDCLYVIRSGDRPVTDTNPDAWTMFRTAMPFRTPNQTVIVQAFEEGKEGILDFLVYQEMRTVQFRSQIQPDRLMGNSFHETLALVEKEGIDRSCVPNCLGGDYTYSQFDDWVRMRIGIEDALSPTPLRRNKLATRLLGGGRRHQTMPSAGPNAHVLDSNSAPTQSPAPVAKKARSSKKGRKEKRPIDDDTRKTQALYSRRWYHKKKLDVLGLRQVVKSLRDHNSRLVQESQQLQSLLETARQMEALHHQVDGMMLSPTMGLPSTFLPLSTPQDFSIQNGQLESPTIYHASDTLM